jgi:hypothetical protein
MARDRVSERNRTRIDCRRNRLSKLDQERCVAGAGNSDDLGLALPAH